MPGGLENRIAIPIQAKPTKVIHHRVGGTGNDARPVDVLDAQNHAVIAAARGQPSAQHRIDIADMHTSGWRRSETAGHACLLMDLDFNEPHRTKSDENQRRMQLYPWNRIL